MRAVLFDVDDTLYDQIQPFSRAYHAMFSKKIDIMELFRANRKYSDEVFEASQHGEISMEEMYIYRAKKSFAEFGIKVSDEEALEFQREYEKMQGEIHVSEHIREMLEFLKEKRVKLGVITNGPSKHQREKIHALKLEPYFPEEHIIVSGDYKVAKPEREIFDRAAEKMELYRDDTFFVGDNFDNDIAGARNAGWKAIWFNRRGEKTKREDIKPTYTVGTEEELDQLLRKMFR